MSSKRHDVLVDLALLVGLVAVICFEFIRLQSAPPPDPSLAAPVSQTDVRRVEERGIVLDGSVEISPETRGAIDPEGRATSTRSVLEDVRVAIATPKRIPELELVWSAVAVSLHEDRLAAEAIGELARNPESLKAHGPKLDDLNRLAQGQPAKDLPALVDYFEKLGTTTWLTERLRARQAANSGDVATAEAAVAAAQGVARRFVSAQLSVIGIQLGLMLLGLVTLVLFPLLVRSRLAARGHRGLDRLTSPFRLDRTRRVFLGWWLFIKVAANVAGPFFLRGTPDPTAFATLNAVSTVCNLVIALAVIHAWALDGGRPGLAEALRLRMKDAPGGVVGLALWFIPAVAVAVVALNLAAFVGALIFPQPEQLQEAIKLLMNNAEPTVLFIIGFSAVIAAPLGEEILFRGVLYRNFRDSMSRPVAMALSGMLFALVHMHAGYFIPLAGLGAALALLYEWTGSLWVPILAHAAWNAFTLVQVHATYHF